MGHVRDKSGYQAISEMGARGEFAASHYIRTMPPLSVLDLSPVTSGHSGAEALRNSLDLAQHADRLGYTRYWLAEHHNLPAIASAAIRPLHLA